MKQKIVLVIAPHPDDETLGCGGTILKHLKKKDQINWLIMTKIELVKNYKKITVKKKINELKRESKRYKFKSMFR